MNGDLAVDDDPKEEQGDDATSGGDMDAKQPLRCESQTVSGLASDRDSVTDKEHTGHPLNDPVSDVDDTTMTESVPPTPESASRGPSNNAQDEAEDEEEEDEEL